MTGKWDISWLRLSAWAGLAVFVAIRTGLAVAPLEPLAEMVAADTLTYLLPIALAVIATGAIAFRLRAGIERRFWALLSIATAQMLIVESHWTWYSATIDFHGPPITSPVRILYVVAAALFIALILTMTRFTERSFARRLRFYADMVAGMVAAFAGAYVFWALPIAHHKPTVATAVQFALYPVFGVTIWISVGAVLLGWKAYAWRSWERLVVASLGIFGLGLVLAPVWYDQWVAATEPSATWITLLLGGGVYLLCIAAVHRLTAGQPDALVEPWPVPRSSVPPLARAYPVALAVLLPVAGWYALAFQGTPAGMPIVIAAALLALLLVARSWLTALEIAHHRLSAVTDEVTGAYNERYLRSRLDELIGGITGYEVCAALFEIADLGRVMDSYGREEAERALRRVADTMVAQSPPGTEVFRLGDGRLAALLPETSIETSMSFAASVVVRASRPAAGEGGVRVAVFAGVASFPEHALDPEGLLGCAQAALEAARESDEGHVAVFTGTSPLSRGRDGVDLRALRETVRALAAAVDARDPATRNHSANCAELATSLARRLGLDEERVQLIGLAALMHDVGKIGMSDEILLKPGPLTAEERRAVMEHSELGQRILEPANLGDITPLVRHHHERWDGAGYPDGLCGENIPLEARIMAVCDTYETLTAGRPYKQAVSMRRALDEVADCAGSQFDPEIVREFLAMMDPHVDRERQRAGMPFHDLAGESGA